MAQGNLSSQDRAMLSLSDGDFLRFRQLMEDRFGLQFSLKRRTELEMGVRRAFAVSTCADLHSYLEILSDPVHGILELERLANCLTVGETYFFRDAGQMDALARFVLPEIIERRRAVRTLRIWSAGCSSGEEPYSIAMLLKDLIPDLNTWSLTILATDINTQNLSRAKQGLYGEWAFREERARQVRQRFFQQRGNQYELSPEIRRMVTFGEINLAQDLYPAYETNTMFLDLIICRNVTIYLQEAVTRAVIDRFYNSLADGGWLVIGHSEHSLTTYQSFRAHPFPETLLYQRGKGPADVIDHRNPKALGQATAQSVAAAEPKTKTNDAGLWPEKPLSQPPLSAPVLSRSLHHNTLPASIDNFELAQGLVAGGKLDEARELLLQCLADRPNHAPACTLLGKVYANLSNWQEAERWCQLGLSVDALNLDAWYTLALVYQHQGQHARAVEMLKKVVYIDHRDILGHFSLANLLYKDRQLLPALKSLENARKLLEAMPVNDLIPRAEDISVGRLAQTVVELMQIWAKEAMQTITENDPAKIGGQFLQAGNGKRVGA